MNIVNTGQAAEAIARQMDAEDGTSEEDVGHFETISKMYINHIVLRHKLFTLDAIHEKIMYEYYKEMTNVTTESILIYSILLSYCVN